MAPPVPRPAAPSPPPPPVVPQVFKAHYHTILRLKQHFPFSLIDAMGTLEECREQVCGRVGVGWGGCGWGALTVNHQTVESPGWEQPGHRHCPSRRQPFSVFPD